MIFLPHLIVSQHLGLLHPFQWMQNVLLNECTVIYLTGALFVRQGTVSFFPTLLPTILGNILRLFITETNPKQLKQANKRSRGSIPEPRVRNVGES